jgi:hypothetical protein
VATLRHLLKPQSPFMSDSSRLQESFNWLKRAIFIRRLCAAGRDQPLNATTAKRHLNKVT